MKQEKCICMLKKYITDNIETLLKEPRDFIRYPFIDPGSVYGGNVWDWDTYWSVYGLLSIFQRRYRKKFWFIAKEMYLIF